MDALVVLPPAEVGALLHRRPHPRRVAATLIDLAQRGHLRVECTSRTRWGQGRTWRLVTAPRAAWSAVGGLRPHEVHLLDVVAHLPLATALGVLDGRRAPDAGDDVGGPLGEPAWWVPGWREEDRGWRGALAFACAAAHREPNGPDWGALDLLGGISW